MILYLDTSALVKLYVDEPGSDLVRGAAARAGFRGCHIVGYAEACAALGRRGREAGLLHAAIEARIEELARDWSRLDVIAADWPLVRRAGELAVKLRLCGYDSLHLAAAEAVWTRAEGVQFRFAAFDSPLVEAARGMGMEVL